MERLQYKIKNGPRVESINEFTLNDNTIVAMFQGFRGSYPELDFIVKYKEPTKKLRTPSHTHWIVDLLVKAEFDKEMVRDFRKQRKDERRTFRENKLKKRLAEMSRPLRQERKPASPVKGSEGVRDDSGLTN